MSSFRPVEDWLHSARNYKAEKRLFWVENLVFSCISTGRDEFGLAISKCIRFTKNFSQRHELHDLLQHCGYWLCVANSISLSKYKGFYVSILCSKDIATYSWIYRGRGVACTRDRVFMLISAEAGTVLSAVSKVWLCVCRMCWRLLIQQ